MAISHSAKSTDQDHPDQHYHHHQHQHRSDSELTWKQIFQAPKQCVHSASSNLFAQPSVPLLKAFAELQNASCVDRKQENERFTL